MGEKTITITKKQLVEANARACSNVMDTAGEKGISGKTGTLFVLIGALLNAELARILFPEENDAEEKLAESLKGDDQ